MIIPKTLHIETITVRNQRTLLWLQEQDTSIDWSKWDGFVTSIPSFYHWAKYNINIVGILIDDLHGSIDETLEHITLISKIVKIVLISHKVLDTKSKEFWADNFDNLIDIDTITQQYPVIGKPWNGTDNDAVMIFAGLCRYNRVIDCSSERINENIIIEHNIQPTPTWVVTQFFKHSNRRRFREIKNCLIKNCECPEIDKIVLINEKDYSEEWADIKGSDKIQQIISGTRLTYADFLKYVSNDVPNNVFVALCNADIYFDESVLELSKINMNDRMLALLRWNDDGSGKDTAKIFGPRDDSQDAWIFLSNSIKSRTFDYSNFNFQLGRAGCDNAFAGEILRNRFFISNPCYNIKTYHIHNTNIRNYDKYDIILSRYYVKIVPSFLVDSKQEKAPITYETPISHEAVPFEVNSSSISNSITYCTMLEKTKRYKWEPSIENFYFQAKIPVYLWKNAGVTPNGLVYDYNNIYKGLYADKNPDFNYWGDNQVNILTPLNYCKRIFAIPFKNTDNFKNPDLYILNYLSRCTRLLSIYPETSFWIPKEFGKYVLNFTWNTPTLRGVYFNEDKGCWADEVIGFLPDPANTELGKEDITAIREKLSEWKQKPSEKLCTIVLGSAITQKFVEENLTEFLLHNDENWTVRFVNESDYGSYGNIVGASLCIFIGGKQTTERWARLWALPEDCRVIEFQQELQIDGEFQHLAHVAGFKSWILLLSKGPDSDVQAQIMEQLERWFKKNGEELDIQG